MLILILLAMIIAIIVLTIKYIRLNAKLLSRDAFQEEAIRRARELEYQDPVISCDACGSKFDTAKYKYCPSCGSGFSLDDEWKRRHDADLDWASINADEFSDAKIDQAIARTAKIAKTLKIIIITLVVSFVLLIVLALIASARLKRSEYMENELVNSGEYDRFEKQAYQVIGDGILVDKSGFKVTLTGFYAEEERYPSIFLGEEYFPVKMEYKVENRSGKDQRLSFSLDGLNGIAKDNGFSFFYGLFKDGTSVTVYDEIWSVRGAQIKELVIGDFKVFGPEDDAVLEEKKENIKLKTSASYQYPSLEIPGEANFENESVAVYYVPYDPSEKGKALLVVNKTDFDLLIVKSREKFGDTEQDGRIYKSSLPAHYTYVLKDSRMSVLSRESQEKTGHKLSLSFTCPSDPSKDFSTPYFSTEE